MPLTASSSVSGGRTVPGSAPRRPSDRRHGVDRVSFALPRPGRSAGASLGRRGAQAREDRAPPDAHGRSPPGRTTSRVMEVLTVGPPPLSAPPVSAAQLETAARRDSVIAHPPGSS